MYSSVIAALAEMFAKLFDWRTVETKYQADKEVIKDKRDYKKATNIAERLIDIADKYKSKMSRYHAWRYEVLCKLFKKYN